MIYTDRAAGDEIFQGDVFQGVPFVDLSLEHPVFFAGESEEGSDAKTWAEIVAEKPTSPIGAFVTVTPRPAMVISQDCDISREHGSVLLAAIDEFGSVHREVKQITSPDAFQKHITKISKVALKWFYLPVDPNRELFTTKKAADFQLTTRVATRELRDLQRIAGLNEYAREHLRHRVAYFFQRYPVDDWYSLDAQEFEIYKRQHADAKPYPWQA